MNPYSHDIYWYGRYIDDIIIVWASDMTARPHYVNYINNNLFGLRSTYMHYKVSMPLLDLYLMAYVEAGVVHTNTYCNLTASNMILHARSCCPSHTIRGIPVGELVRSKRNCSTIEQFEEAKANTMTRPRKSN